MAADPGELWIIVYGPNNTNQPTLTPNPSSIIYNWTYNSGENGYWQICLDDSVSSIPITVSATGFNDYIVTSSDVSGGGYYTITMTISSMNISQLSDGTNVYAIKDATAREGLSSKQDTLVSGTNIKTINNTSLLGSGDITISTTVDQTYDSTSTNAQSGVAINGAGFLQNKSSSGYSINVFGDDTVGKAQPFNTIIGYGARPYDAYCAHIVAMGYNAKAKSSGIAIGEYAITSVSNAIQISVGSGATNSDSNTFKVANLNGNFEIMSADGTIPVARYNVMTGADGTNAGTKGVVPAPTATDNTKFLRGDGTWATAGSDVEAYTSAEVETLWGSIS